MKIGWLTGIAAVLLASVHAITSGEELPNRTGETSSSVEGTRSDGNTHLVTVTIQQTNSSDAGTNSQPFTVEGKEVNTGGSNIKIVGEIPDAGEITITVQASSLAGATKAPTQELAKPDPKAKVDTASQTAWRKTPGY